MTWSGAISACHIHPEWASTTQSCRHYLDVSESSCIGKLPLRGTLTASNLHGIWQAL
jgi:hypothetical protein